MRIVLSLFDGMSCGQIALKKLGVDYDKYYASEIDKHAIKVTQHNFPNTIQLGDVTTWREWDIDWDSVELVLAGSPCQGFSFAGKQLAFYDKRSALFFVFVEIWGHVQKANPKAKFLLENVKMKKEHELVISRYMGVAPIEINSALLSAQNRVRLYWTNIANKTYGLFGDMMCVIPQPKDKGILLRDILETDVSDKYYLSEKMLKWLSKHSEKRGTEFKQLDGNQKASCLTTTEAKQNLSNDYICVVSRGRNPENLKSRIRRLTPSECARLQTIPKWYDMSVVSDTQRYRMLGNGWTVDVIVHILSYLASLK